ncbi:ABC transporter ATP-binding protein [Ruminococcus sp.]|uniref:ABC transporter ATP-binding protein n=1 Tax=Ruminococcus sp. TaxID=41978 RepID=UPI0025EAE6DC|nr:ABC transporter ATP-binding protein [Ruminococcus sp.]MCI5816591.1 ABC transporter ATP-binding protein [Ruminococcus sp.]MDD7556300.1 ABC transporter ATP-binding protein [Ruminococcus sp.]MDY4964564.1 ABC transporter ATP-binding protein [Ruminococcus callidus]
METALKIEHLNKYFGKRQILHDICMEVYAGEVFGFLGPNGAGKTTTIKIVVGLLRLDEGDVQIHGHSVTKNYEDAMACVGGIVENPELYKYMTGRENLRQYARMRKGVDEARIDEVVKLVGLSNRIDDKVSKYSLGMRQRLGVAQALLHHPKLLILDEPTNGLDPAGIKELRDILKNLAHKENIAVLVSSHLMSEMEMMCDRVGVIVGGKMLDVRTTAEMISAAQDTSIRYTVKVSDPARAAELLTQLPENAKQTEGDELVLRIETDKADEIISGIIETLVSNQIRVMTCIPEQTKRLEDVFIAMTQENGGAQIG